MRKLFSLFAAALVAVAVNADPVVLPATLDVNNVSFRSEGMPDFVLADGDYAGTYFDMGAHDSANDTLLYAEWDVTVEPIIYTVAADLYNPNGWMAHIELLDQNDQVLKVLRFTGSWGKSGQFAAGAMDLRDLAAGNYKVRARAAVAWSQMKLKDLIFVANYAGVAVDLPGTLLPAYAELSSGASVANDAIVFNPGTANTEYATWNVNFAAAGTYNVTIDMTASNGHNYGVALLSADGATEIGAVSEGSQKGDTGVKELGAIEVPAAGSYVVKLTNATQWSEAVLNSITFAGEVAPAEPKFYVAGSMTSWGDNKIAVYEDSYVLENLAANTYQLKVIDGDDWLGFDALTEKTPGLFKDDWGNINFTLAEAGDITVTFIKENGQITTFTVKGNYVLPSVTLAGSMNSWSPTAEGYAFTPAEDKLTASLTVTLNDYYYEFKVVVGGSLWMGKETGGNYYELKRDWNTVSDLVADKPNLVIKPDVVPGDYTFIWTFANNALEVIFPSQGGDESAITNTAVDAQIIKTIENGQLIIIKNGVKYDVHGTIIR